ncbi:MAG TPA: ABC transporter ATP-binding protein [Ktedonobacteraceae bacterium]|nr:ABC transporter ATP-binding protein [Ktedonobacteraceae bacterium]
MRVRTRSDQPEEKFRLSQTFKTLASVPRVMRLVWSTNAPLTASLAFLSILRGITPVVTVTISQLVIDSVVYGIRTHSINPIWLPIGFQLGMSVLDRLLATISNIVQQLLQERVADRIQLMILEKANTLDLAFFENAEFYDKLRRAADESTYKPVSMISQTFDLGRTTITLFSMILLLSRLVWWLAIVALLIPIPSFIANSRYGWMGYMRMRRQSPERRQLLYFNQVMTLDTFNKEVKLFNLGDFFIRRYHHLAEKFYNENKQVVVPRYLTGLLWSGITLLANGAIYLYVALQAVLGHISLGALTKYTQASVQVGQNFQGVLDGLSNTYENNLFVNTLFEFLEYEPAILSPEHPVALEPVASEQSGLEIEFRNVSFTYPGKQEPALKNVSFRIRAGEAIALVGRNGAGKTTLVKLLTRLYDPDEGEVLLSGRNVKEYDLKELREHIGVIFQDYVHYHLNARENIGVGHVADVENMSLISSAAGKSGADVVIDRLADGYESMLGRWFEKGVQLSGGEWQKIALARAFMRDAQILVLDEPTSALDAQAEYDVFTRFRQLTQRKTAVFISHRFSTVRLADRIFVIEHGGIIESGSHEELMALHGRYAELFNLQAEAYR